MATSSRPDPLAKAERLFRLAALLREGHLSVRDIALKLYPTAPVGGEGWSGIERAVQRDLNDIERLEPAFKPLKGRPPRYTIETHRTQLHPVEVLALHSAARMTYHRAPGQRLHHQKALQKLTEWLPERLQPVVGRGMSDLGQRRRSREDLNLELAARSWLEGYPLRFEYRKPGGSGQWRTNVIEPYLIETHPQNLDLYVVGLETTFHQGIRTFKLARMHHLQVMTEQRYSIPESFDPSAFFHHAWGVVGSQGNATEIVSLRFRADAAYRIREGGYAYMSEPVVSADGSVNVQLTAPLDGSGLPREVLPWIYSFGPRVEVLGPSHLREHWLRELREAVSQGGKG